MKTMPNGLQARNNRETEGRLVQEHIIFVERTIAELRHVFAQYSRKVARLRDKGDEIVKCVVTYSESERINKSLSLALKSFADCISIMGSYGDLRVHNLENKVVQEFGRYEDICKCSKEEVKQVLNAKEREVICKKQLDRIKERNPRNRQQIIQAETELIKASANFSKTLRNFEEKTAQFEKQKLHDMKSILFDFITTEMGYHAKVLEVLSNAFEAVSSINEESDLEEFKKSLRISDATTGSTKCRHLFTANGSLGSLGQLFSKSNKKSQSLFTGSFKSEERINSLKQSISDNEEEGSSETVNISETVMSDSEEVCVEKVFK